ncbi:STAS/SEC14 domain-containing protein [Methylocystis sp. L43]|nr:STAS/SEC14 domain-containing protein [Methylocystis sp. L43]MBG0805953.1 STAS/SEC14 domain-containing protein [Methylocystis sp. H15]
MIEQLSNFPENVVAIVCRGRVTKADYDAVLVPAVRDALKKHDKVRIYYEIAPDFSGFDPGAIWEDFRVGMEHLTRWERVALVTDVEWIKQTMQFFSFMMPGDMKAFPTAQADEARDWIVAQ